MAMASLKCEFPRRQAMLSITERRPVSGGELEPMDKHKCPRKRKYSHHYHAPTVEDMLWKLLGDIRPDMEDEEALPIVAAYAKKLRLVEEKE